MRKITLLVSACLSVFAAASLAARAEDAGEIFAKHLLGAAAPGQKLSACFVRRYDAAHLKQHRRQTVSTVRLLVSAGKLKDDAEFSYSLKIGINFRNRSGNFISNGFCGHARAEPDAHGEIKVHCLGDCGGGGVEVARGSQDKAVMLRLDEIAVWLADKPDDAAGQIELRGGADDKYFRLDRADLSECEGLGGDGADLWPAESAQAEPPK